MVEIIEKWRHIVDPSRELAAVLDRYIYHVVIYKHLRASGSSTAFPEDAGAPWPSEFWPLVQRQIASLEEEQERLLSRSRNEDTGQP